MKSILFTLLALTGLVFSQVDDATPGTDRKVYADSLFVKEGNSYWESVEWLPKQWVKFSAYKDVASLANATADSVGAKAWLAGITDGSPHGAGMVVYELSSNYAANNVTSYSAGASGRVWVRQAYIDGDYIDTRWAGLTPDDDTDDDSLAITMAIAAAQTLNAREIYFPAGTIAFNGPITLDQKAGQFTYGNRLIGPAYATSQITTKNDTTAFKIRTSSGNFANRFEFHNLTLIGPGAGVAGDSTCGIYGYKITQTVIKNCQIEDWKMGVFGHRIEGSLIEQSRIISNYDNIRFKSNANGNTIYNTSFGQGTRYNFYQTGGSGTTIIGGEGGNAEVQWYFEDCNAVIIGGNIESIDDTYLKIDNSKVQVLGTRMFTTGNDTVTLAEITGSAAALKLGSFVPALGREDSLVIVDNSSSVIIYDGAVYNQKIGGYHTTFGHFPLGPFIPKPFDATGNPAISAVFRDFRGYPKFIFREQGTTDVDKFYLGLQSNDTTWYDLSLTDGAFWKLSINAAQESNWARQDRLAHFSGKKSYSTAGGTDSTVVDFVIPRLSDLGNSVYSVVSSVKQVSGYEFNPIYMGGSQGATQDTLNFTVWHRNNTVGAIPFILHVNIKAKIPAETFDD